MIILLTECLQVTLIINLINMLDGEQYITHNTFDTVMGQQTHTHTREELDYCLLLTKQTKNTLSRQFKNDT